MGHALHSKEEGGLWSLFINNVFESFNKVNLYKELLKLLHSVMFL